MKVFSQLQQTLAGTSPQQTPSAGLTQLAANTGLYNSWATTSGGGCIGITGGLTTVYYTSGSTIYPNQIYPHQHLYVSTGTGEEQQEDDTTRVEKWMKANVLQAKEVIESYLAHNIPTFLWGPPGIGKSDIVREIADEQGIGFIDLRLSQLDPVDLRGFPFVVDNPHKGKNDESMKIAAWAPPVFLPRVERDGAKGILFLDELNLAPQSVLSAAYQLVLNRRVGEYVMPKGWKVVAAGNRQEDRSGVQALPRALANRFAHIDVVPDPAAWVEWAVRSGVPPVLVAYMRIRGVKSLHDMSGVEHRAFPTPRAWAQVGKVISERGERRKRMVAGLIGDAHAGEFLAFLDETASIPTLAEILADPANAKVPEGPSRRHVVTTMLADGANEKNIVAILQYAQRALPREFEMLMIVDALRRSPALGEHKAVKDWKSRTEKKSEATVAAEPQKGDFVKIVDSSRVSDGVYKVEDVGEKEEDGVVKKLLRIYLPNNRDNTIAETKRRIDNNFDRKWFKVGDLTRIEIVKKPDGAPTDGWVLIGGSRWTRDGWYALQSTGAGEVGDEDRVYINARGDGGEKLGVLWTDGWSVVGYGSKEEASTDPNHTMWD